MKRYCWEIRRPPGRRGGKTHVALSFIVVVDNAQVGSGPSWRAANQAAWDIRIVRTVDLNSKAKMGRCGGVEVPMGKRVNRPRFPGAKLTVGSGSNVIGRKPEVESTKGSPTPKFDTRKWAVTVCEAVLTAFLRIRAKA